MKTENSDYFLQKIHVLANKDINRIRYCQGGVVKSEDRDDQQNEAENKHHYTKRWTKCLNLRLTNTMKTKFRLGAENIYFCFTRDIFALILKL